MYIKEVLKELESEMDKVSLGDAEDFLESESSSNSFNIEFSSYLDKMSDENKERDSLIIKYIMLGMGRDRTINILKSYGVNRTIYERVRDKFGLKDNIRRQENEKKITKVKWESKARKRRKKKLAKIDFEKLKEEYVSGESIVSLSKKYDLEIYLITQQLQDENILDETRSTSNKKDVAEKNFANIDNNFIITLSKENPLDNKHDLWIKAKERYPWLLRRQMYLKMEELDLIKSKDEINEIRRIKSKGESNKDYQIKLNGYRAVKEIFKSVDKLVELYMKNSLGSYTKIADKINDGISFDYKISSRQVSKIITRNENYVRRKSLGQQQLFSFIKSVFSDELIIEEYSYSDESQNKIDIYIPSMNIGFEFNGEYWHSDAVINYNYGKTAYDFHEERRKDLSNHNIKLLYVWEDDWDKNYGEVEDAIINKKWNSAILNKMEGNSNRKFSSPDKMPSLLRNQVMRFLKENNIEFKKNNNSHIIEILNHNIVINVPNYNSLSQRKESLRLQKYYEEKSIELITLLPWRDIYKVKEYLSYRLKLKSIIKIPARKCDVVITEGITEEQKKFFADNHILGYEIDFRYVDKTVSLTYDGETVISTLFLRKKGSQEAELKRLVSAYGVSVQGGASKLLTAYIRETEGIKAIMTYSDCDLGFGNVYKTLGFELMERSPEQLTWFHEDELRKLSNRSLVLIGADRLLRNHPNYLPVGIGANLPSNQEIVEAYGFIPIYDSGYKKWKYILK